MKIFCLFLNGAICALNASLFVEYGNPWNLGAAIFSGIVALWVLTWDF